MALTIKDKLELGRNRLFCDAVRIAVSEHAINLIASIQDPASMTPEQVFAVEFRMAVANPQDPIFAAAANWILSLDDDLAFRAEATHDSVMGGLMDSTLDSVLRDIVADFFPLLAKLRIFELQNSQP